MIIKRLIMIGVKKPEDMTERECFELALLIDTEGSIDVEDRIRPHIKVGMASIIIPKIARLWGGTIYKVYMDKENDKFPFYDWNVNRRSLLRSILHRIKPYLQVKQKQAELALKMIDILDDKKGEYKEELKRLATEISMLNHMPAPDLDWVPSSPKC